MNKSRLFAVASALAIVSLAPSAFAQTPTYISVISGNGQISCPECTQQGYGLQSFNPLYVKVTDANGNPVSGASVNWTVVSGQGTFLSSGSNTAQTTTDVNGNTNIQYILYLQSLSGSTLNPYSPSTISASISSGASVNFYEFQALVSTTTGNTNVPVFISVYNPPGGSSQCPTCINPGDVVTGPAGSTSATQFQVQVYVAGSGVPIPNVSFRLVSNQASPTVSCATGAGADPGSVLTNANGIANCTLVLGTTTGSGSFYFLVGGVNAAYSQAVDANGNPTAVGFFSSGNYGLVVTPGVAGMISIAGGNNQGANPGQALPTALVATVADSSGNPLSGQQVVWTVSPTGAATLSNTTTTSNSSGRVQTNVTLSSSAAGTIQVKAALASNPSISTTFTLTANIQVSSLQVLSGSSQTAVVGAPFGSPLVVQLATINGASVANIPVSFNIVAGNGTLSASSATTNSSGQAQVSVTAGSATGPLTVTATAGGFSVTFNLTVIPQGPTLTSSSFYNGADFQQGSLSPCSIATIIAPGVASAIQGTLGYSGIGALPYALGSDSLTVGGAQAPIYNVSNVNGQQQLSFQVPCSVTPGTNAATVSVGGSSTPVSVTVLPASPGIFSTVIGTTTIPVLERPDGSFVSPSNPARRGETLIAFATGLGPTTPSVATNSLPVPGGTATVQGTVIAGVNGGGATVISAALSPDIVGVYEVTFVVPSSVPSGTNTDFSVGLLPQGTSKVYYSTLGYFPVQ